MISNRNLSRSIFEKLFLLESHYCIIKSNRFKTVQPQPFKRSMQRLFKSILRECLYEKKRPSNSPVNRVPQLAGMILVFVYMISFVSVCRDENSRRYCF